MNVWIKCKKGLKNLKTGEVINQLFLKIENKKDELSAIEIASNDLIVVDSPYNLS
jgi:hypothetical protein